MTKRYAQGESAPSDGALQRDLSAAPARVTIRDVAHGAGVSITTASRALNNTGRMSAETRERVQAAATAMGYRPNSLARGLVGQRSFAVGLLTNDTYGRFTLPIAAGLSSAMADRGVSVFLCAGEDDPERIRLNLEAMQDRRVDGLVVSGKRVDRTLPVNLEELGIPVLYVNSACPPGAIGFVPDDHGAAMEIVQYLVSLGKRRIAHITGPLDFAAAKLRAEGWIAGLDARGMEPFGEARFGSWSENFGHLMAQDLFSGVRDTWPDAVFCGNDQIARGLIDAAVSMGISVPDDVAVIGFDNWEIFAGATRPPLTTWDMDLLEMGREAGRTLLDLIDAKPVEPGLRRLPCRGVIRQSCGGYKTV